MVDQCIQKWTYLQNEACAFCGKQNTGSTNYSQTESESQLSSWTLIQDHQTRADLQSQGERRTNHLRLTTLQGFRSQWVVSDHGP